MTFEGLDDVIDQMGRMGMLAAPVADEMLVAGAGEMKKAWVNAINRFNHVDTGQMRRSVGFGRKPESNLSARSLDVYPRGKDKKGVRNAEKAFVLHYGRSGSKPIPASHFVDVAETEGEPKAAAAMEARWDRFVEKGS